MRNASEDDDLVPISALQHLAFCPRQCALIHVERVWAENELTAEGRVVHERADLPGLSGAGRVVRALELRSERLGLSGRADVVEFLPPGEPGGAEIPFPIEYKRGRASHREADRIQLCAQAMSLEEMLGTEVPRGAVYYHGSRRRVAVEFDASLRAETARLATVLHRTMADGSVPRATEMPKCRRCSIREICQPDRPGGETPDDFLAMIALEADGHSR